MTDFNEFSPGRYQQQVRLQAPPARATPGRGGDPVPQWTDLVTLWAEVVTLTGRELVNAQETKETINTRVRFRYIPGVTSTMRGVWNGQVLNFESVIDRWNRHVEIEVLASVTQGESP